MPEPLKDRYNTAYFERLEAALQTVQSDFPAKAFRDQIFDAQWDERELKDRMHHIAAVLHNVLPGDYREQLAVLKPVAARFEPDFLHMHFPDFVEQFGLDDPAASLPALEHFTRFSSAEFAIRPFIVRYPEQAMAQLLTWTQHEDYHVRRLASEGCRPRLPWAMALPRFKADPSPVIRVLKKLYRDPSEYVRRSVANNLNDIAKDHPQVTLRTVAPWKGKNPQTNRLVRHACRGLLKQAHPEALQLFGFGDPAKVAVHNLALKAAVLTLGDTLHVAFSVHNPEQARLRLEYKIHYRKANGSLSPKVFQIAEGDYAAGERVYQLKQRFENLSTRKHYPGEHRLTICVNGVEKAAAAFTLTLG
ncbi:MAG: DNA alkylation repair protein [Bacteroidota bacterium]